MRYNYYKLVRDNIPNEINKSGGKCSYKILNDEEYKNELDKKLQEESNEFIECHSVEEMADLLEVIECQIKTFNINIDEVKKAREKKAKAKGGFKNKIYLEYVDENENIEEKLNNRNKQQSLLNLLTKKDSLTDVQNYVRQVNELRGFQNQDLQDTMLLLTEEIGEIAKAIRKDYTDMSVDINKLNNYGSIESEIADVFYVLSCVCNKLDINILDALKKKEAENINRTWNKV